MDFQASVFKSAEEIFPLEVWALILDKLESPHDLANCYRTCQDWQDLLKAMGARFLMPEVFPILHKFLENDEMMKVRTISRSWKESVDSYFRTHPKFSIGKLNSARLFDDATSTFPFNRYNFDVVQGATKLASFLTQSFPPNSNPFIARQIKYSDWGSRSPYLEILQANFKQLLEAFGSQIWNCTLRLTCRNGLTELCGRIRSYLTLMTNLKSLTLAIEYYSVCRDVNSREDAEIMVLLQNEPFPKLERLCELELQLVPWPLAEGILAQNEQLRKLSFYCPYIGNNILGGYLVNLEHLILRASSKVELVHFQRLTWPLKTLELQLDFGKLDTVFQAVNTFSNTLEQLTIYYSDNEEDNKDLRKLRIQLPNLKEFNLITPFRLETIDFLVDCKALQCIDLCIGISSEEDAYVFSGERSDDPASVIQFYKYITAMQKSNIWNVLPNLGFINIETTAGFELYPHYLPKAAHRFTRCQSEKYVKKLNGVKL